MLVPSPFAVYRPAHLRPGPFDATAVGVCHYNAVAVLEQERLTLIAEEDAIIKAGEKAKRLSPEQSKRADAISLRLGDLNAAIATEKARRERELSAPAAGAAEEAVVFDLREGGSSLGDERRLSALQARPGRTGRTYADLFGQPRTAAAEGWGSLNDFLSVLHSKRHDDRILAATSMGGTVGSEGGFLVPEQYSAELLDAALEDEIVRPRARVYPITQGDTRNIAGFDGRDHSANLYGLQSKWMGEAGTNTRQKAKTRLIKLIANKLAIFAGASNELVADGMTFEELLGDAMREAIGFDLDEAFLNGNGVAKPLGVLNDPALITIAKEAAQAADTILYENLVKMFARMHPRGRRSCVWVASSTTIPQLATLSVVIGTGGAHIPVMTESNGEFKILTRPVIFTEKVPVLGDPGDISLIDFSQYAIGMRKEAVVDRATGPGWFEDETDYRVITRVDGRGRWAAPLTPRKGDTLSWAVALAARA